MPTDATGPPQPPPVTLPRQRSIWSTRTGAETRGATAARYSRACLASSVMVSSEPSVTWGLTTSAASTPRTVPGCGVRM